MTNPTPHGQVPEALIDLIDAYAETRHRCGGVYNAKTEAARKAVIEALSGVQALSAAPAGWKLVPEDATEEMVRATDKVNFANADTDGTMHNVWNVMLAASPPPTSPAEQQAPSAAVFGLRLVPVEPTDQMVQAAHHIDLSYMPGQEGADRAAIYRAMIAAAPQPAPAPVSEPIDQLERALAIIGVVGAIDGHDVVRRESVLEIARRAALAAQKGK